MWHVLSHSGVVLSLAAAVLITLQPSYFSRESQIYLSTMLSFSCRLQLCISDYCLTSSSMEAMLAIYFSSSVAHLHTTLVSSVLRMALFHPRTTGTITAVYHWFVVSKDA